MDLLDCLLEHDHWATRTLLEVSRDLTDAQLDQAFDIGHRTLRATFEHIVPNVGFWAALMAGEPTAAQPSDLSIPALIDLHERSYATFSTVARTLRDEQRLEDIFVDHYQARKTYGGTMLMVITHNEGHRFEALHILERLGVSNLPEVDLGMWDYERVNG